jgi:uncharacterized membrane protein YkgB
MLGALNRQRVKFENSFFGFLRRISIPLSRGAFFIVFFWFGLLKVLGLSPADNYIHTLWSHTTPFIPWSIYIVFFGAYEMLIGIIFLFPGKEKWVLYMLVPHAITTFEPLILTPRFTWKAFLIPNLIGQYIIKNMAIIALAIFIAAYVWENKKNGKKNYAGDQSATKK